MGIWKGLVWAFGRNTEWGDRQLGRETVLERAAREMQIRLGRVAIQATGRLDEPPRWAKYQSSVHRGTNVAQTNYFEGYIGETDPRRKVHIAVDEYGRLLYVRDIDGTELFDRSRGDTPPPGWS